MSLWSFDALPSDPDVPPGDWLPAAADAFSAGLLAPDPPYPCDFGVRAHRLGHNHATVLDRRGVAGLELPDLAASLRAFASLAATGPTRQSLVVFCGPPDPTARLAEDRTRFWDVLTGLSTLDERPWPSTVPVDPAHPGWQWCFAGEPWFVFALSPAYVARRSRSIVPCLTLVLQTARVFTGIGGATAAGRRAKRRIRARLAAYDAVAPHPHLGDPERSSDTKWRQYLLPDDQTLYPPDQCPYRQKGDAHVRDTIEAP